MRKPNLFIVGAAKAGTTSLYNYLSQHSDIFMCPIKEPNFFCKDIKRNSFTQKNRFYSYFDIDKYLSNDPLNIIHNAFIEEFNDYIQLYRDVKNEQIIGEASTSYLYSTQAAKEIHKYNPDAKIIIILRNPIDRAFSHWKMNLSAGFEKKKDSFLEAIQNDFNSRNKGYYRSHLYIELGLYFEQVKRYINIFPKNQILILLYDDFIKNRKETIERIFTFSNIPLQLIDVEKNHNVSKIQRFPAFTKFVRKYNLKKFVPETSRKLFKTILNSRKVLTLNNNIRLNLYEYFKVEIPKLELLSGLDLSSWKIQ